MNVEDPYWIPSSWLEFGRVPALGAGGDIRKMCEQRKGQRERPSSSAKHSSCHMTKKSYKMAEEVEMHLFHHKHENT